MNTGSEGSGGLRIMSDIGNTFFFQWEVSLMAWIQAHMGAGLTAVFSFFTICGEEIPMVVIIGFVYWSLNKKLGRDLGIAVLAGLVWNTMIKNIFCRRRPYFDHKEIKILRKVKANADVNDVVAQGFSFPSSHATNSVTLFATLARGVRKRWMTVICIIMPIGIGVSRFALGAHYPTDVMTGWLIGGISVVIISFLQAKIPNTMVMYGILLLTAVPGFFYCKSPDYFTSVGLLIGFMAGTLFEDRYVRFENTRNIFFMILRLAGALLVFVVIDKILRLPFSPEFISSATAASFLVRCVRYAIVAFVSFGVYPMAFRFEKRQGGRQAEQR